MKYYYAKNVDGAYGKLSVGRNLDNVIEDHNKIIVIVDESIFHVLTYNNSICEEEKKIFDSSELINHLKENKKNVYFFKTSKYLPTLIINDVDTNKEQLDFDFSLPNESVYTLKNNEIVKFEAFINRAVLKKAIRDLYIKKYNDEDCKFIDVSLRELINNQTLLDMYHLPYVDKRNCYEIPAYSYTSPNLFYILNGIYSKLGDDINLNEQNLKDLFIESFSEDKEIVDKIIKNIRTTIVNKYELDEFSKSLDYIENVKEQEHDYSIELKKAKYILKKANKNEQMINELNIIKEENKVEEKNNSKIL